LQTTDSAELFLFTGNRIGCGTSKTPSLDDSRLGDDDVSAEGDASGSERSAADDSGRVSFLATGAERASATFGKGDTKQVLAACSVLMRLRILSSFCFRMALLNWAFDSGR
jgi:hypothetical protein